MRGFATRASVDDVLRWIDATAQPLPSEGVELTQAAGRVLAEAAITGMDVPPFDRSAMDGYAVHASDTDGASDYNPLVLAVVGESLPGRPYPDALPMGKAVRIMTGAPLPAGADAVIPVEYTSPSDGSVEITSTVTPGKHVGRRGEDLISGTQLFPAGRRLRPQDVGLLASVGWDCAPVIRRPRVRLLVTGNELVTPGEPRGPYQIFESNSAMLRGLVERDGGIVAECIRCPDDRETIGEALTTGQADVVLVSGGSSVGSEDHAPMVLAEVGELAFHGIAMRPSSPTGLGRIAERLVVLLPGNPVSCLCAYDFFAGRAIRRLGGRRAEWPYVTRGAVLRSKLVSAVGRVDYCRVRLVEDQVEPVAISGASILSSTTRADGFVIVPAALEGYGSGAHVMVFLYEPLS